MNALENPILDMPFQIAVRKPLGLGAHDAPPKPTDDQQQRIIAATEMFICPNNEQDGREFLEMILEDLITLGGGPFEVEDNKSDNRPLFMWPVDVQSIRMNLNWTPDSGDFRYSQGRGYLFGSVGTTDEVKLSDNDLCYPKLNPRTSNPFGYGYLETAFDVVNAYVGAFAYAERRASNNTPNFGLFLGENMTVDQVRRYQHYWENEIEGRGKTPIIGGGRAPSSFNLTGTGEDQLFLKWQEWLVRVIAMSFGVSPMRLGLERDVNRSTAAQGASDDWSTIAPVANTMKQAFTHWLLWKRLGWTDLEYQWNVRTSDELKQADILSLQWSMDAITVDELRKIYDRPALDDGLGDMTFTPFKAAIQSAVAPQQNKPDPGSVETPPKPKGSPAFQGAANPFGDQNENEWNPQQAAFIRSLMQKQRRERYGLEGEVD